jgi:hypothetical protein
MDPAFTVLITWQLNVKLINIILSMSWYEYGVD